jgi:hypothetical protein
VRGRGDPGCPVVAALGADARGEGDDRPGKADLPVLVLDVELERGEPLLRKAQVLFELALDRGERHRDVDAADLGGVGTRLRLRLRLRRRRRRASGGVLARFAGGEEAGAERHTGGGQSDDAKESSAPEGSPPPGLPTPRAESFVRIDRLEEHRTPAR